MLLATTRAVRIHVVQAIILVRQARVVPIRAQPTTRVRQETLAALLVRAVALTPVVCDQLTLALLHHAAPTPAPHLIPAALPTHVRQEIHVPVITRVQPRPVPRLRARQRQVTHVPPAIRVQPIIRAGQGTRVQRFEFFLPQPFVNTYDFSGVGEKTLGD
ncbi:hypothetical protein MACH01_25990 [Thalassospira tepidiphila]|nr:hypothetical protein MACH01_25990 [Thalassospira tepidiphila]